MYFVLRASVWYYGIPTFRDFLVFLQRNMEDKWNIKHFPFFEMLMNNVSAPIYGSSMRITAKGRFPSSAINYTWLEEVIKVKWTEKN